MYLQETILVVEMNNMKLDLVPNAKPVERDLKYYHVIEIKIRRGAR